MISQNKNVCKLVWHSENVDIAVEGSELYCYNTEGNRNTSQVSYRMDVIQLEYEPSKFMYGEAGSI